MKAANFVLSEYFERIGFRGEAKDDVTTLCEMMRAQLYTTPFENLDVQAGKIVSLVPEDIVRKIVQGRRGGYCYEVNGLFAMALDALVIPYRFVAARPMFYPTRRPRTHMAILASVEGRDWLCDLGFGSYGIRAPMALDDLDNEIAQGHDVFRLRMASEREYLLQACVSGEWTNQYSFDVCPQEWIDFAPANYFNSTHPDTVFVQKPVIVLHTPQGRKILVGSTFKNISEGRVSQWEISPEDYPTVLQEQFGLSDIRRS